MRSMMTMPRAWVRAVRLTMRQQRMRPANLGKWAAVFKQKPRHPGRLIERVRMLVEAENWTEFDRLVDNVDPYFFEGLRPIYLHDLDRLERRILVEPRPSKKTVA
jgi:hypothetical protein